MMSNNLIAFLSLGFIILVVVLLFAMARRTGRQIDEAGFAPIEHTPPAIERLVERLLEGSISAAYQKQLEGESAWLVSLRPEGTDDPGKELLIFTLERADLPEVATFHSRVKLPRFMRRASGGVLARLEPATGPVQDGFAGIGWQVLHDPQSPAPSEVTGGLLESAKLREAEALIGMAAADSYLAIWTDGSVRKLLEAGPRIKGTWLTQLYILYMVPPKT
jgi:hypothetical protein